MKHLEFTLTIIDVKEPDLLDFTSLLYDIELVHDLYVLNFSQKYKDIDFDRFFTRYGRPVKSEFFTILFGLLHNHQSSASNPQNPKITTYRH